MVREAYYSQPCEGIAEIDRGVVAIKSFGGGLDFGDFIEFGPIFLQFRFLAVKHSFGWGLNP